MVMSTPRESRKARFELALRTDMLPLTLDTIVSRLVYEQEAAAANRRIGADVTVRQVQGKEVAFFHGRR